MKSSWSQTAAFDPKVTLGYVAHVYKSELRASCLVYNGTKAGPELFVDSLRYKAKAQRAARGFPTAGALGSSGRVVIPVMARVCTRLT